MQNLRPIGPSGRRLLSGGLRVLIIGLPALWLLLFAACILVKSRLLLSPVTLGVAVLFAALLFLGCRRTGPWGLSLVFLFLLAFALRMTFLVLWPITPMSDCKQTYEMSAALAQISGKGWHEALAANLYYYKVWPMHVPFLLFETLCMRLFGTSLFALQTVNVFFSSLTCVFTALCAEGLTGSKRAGWLAGLFMAWNMTSLFMSAFLVNQHVSTALYLLSLVFLLRRPFAKSWKNYGASGIILALAHLMRPEMYIVAIAVGCAAVYSVLTRALAKRPLTRSLIFRKLRDLLCFLLMFFVVLQLANQALHRLRWVDDSIFRTNLEYKLMIGLNQETEGRFLDSDYPLAANELAVKELLRERIAGPLDTLKLMVKKLCFQFSSYNYWWLQADKGGRVRQFVTRTVFEPLTQAYMLIILLLAFFAALRHAKKHDPSVALVYIIWIGYLCAFALLEVQQRYAYLVIPLFTMLAALQADRMLDRLAKRPPKRKNRRRGALPG